MKYNQIYEIVNTMSKEILGTSDIVTEDLSNIVDIGSEIFNVSNVDNYVKKLVDHIGKVVFVNRVYRGKVPFMLRDAWEYGSVLEKIRCEIPEATANDTWQLENGQTYNQDVFTSPKVSVKFYDMATTFEIPMSYADRQVKSSFDSLTQLNAFFSMIENQIDKSMTIKTDALIMATIRRAMAQTVIHNFATETDYSTASYVTCRNLRKEYNDAHGSALTPENCLTDHEFMMFLAKELGLTKGYMSEVSTLFNIAGKDAFTPADMLNFVLLDSVNAALKSYLYASTYNDEFVKLDGFSTVPSWQGFGTNPSFGNCSKIDVTYTDEDGTHSVKMDHVIGFMADRDCMMVACENDRVTTHYNGRAEFTNYWYKRDARYLYDPNENFVMFTIA